MFDTESELMERLSNMTQITKRLSVCFLCLLLFVFSFHGTVLAAAEWPSNVSVNAQGAILMDADTGTVLWGQNIHNQYYPASITKVMTALLVIENCNMDDMVTFSHNAVFNVESGSSNAGINEGDKLSVKDCLYALLLKSANEAANALAEHVAGSTEAFGHRMMRKSNPYYYPGIVGGKTGYTTLAGNTLITCAEKNGMKLITVILKGSTPAYWSDTKNLLDFGFENFVSLKAADYEKTYSSITSDLSFSGLSMKRPEALILDPGSRIILPKTASFTDAKPELSYDISTGDPEGAIAKIIYRYSDRVVGSTFLEINKELFKASETKPAVPEKTAKQEKEKEPATVSESSKTSAGVSDEYREKALKPFQIPLAAWLILGGVGVIALMGGIISFILYKKRKDDEFSLLRKEERMKRLKESGISADEFNSILEQRRSSYTSKRKGRRGGRFKFR